MLKIDSTIDEHWKKIYDWLVDLVPCTAEYRSRQDEEPVSHSSEPVLCLQERRCHEIHRASRKVSTSGDMIFFLIYNSLANTLFDSCLYIDLFESLFFFLC